MNSAHYDKWFLSFFPPELISLRPNVVVDLACGRTEDVLDFSASVVRHFGGQCHYYGVDIREELAPLDHENVHLRRADITNQADLCKKLDLSSANCVILRHPEFGPSTADAFCKAIISTIPSLLREGGVALFSTFIIEEYQNIERIIWLANQALTKFCGVSEAKDSQLLRLSRPELRVLPSSAPTVFFQPVDGREGKSMKKDAITGILVVSKLSEDHLKILNALSEETHRMLCTAGVEAAPQVFC
jgi:hypothetical protein